VNLEGTCELVEGLSVFSTGFLKTKDQDKGLVFLLAS